MKKRTIQKIRKSIKKCGLSSKNIIFTRDGSTSINIMVE